MVSSLQTWADGARRTMLVALAGALLLALSAGLARPVAHADNPLLPGISSQDRRQMVDATDPPWQAIGRVNRGTYERRASGFCTGTLVAPRLVVTARHCVWNAFRKRLLPVDTLHFVAGYQRGDYLGHARARRLILPEAADPTGQGRSSFAQAQADWVLLVLEQPLTRITPMPWQALTVSALQARAPQGVLAQAGYSRDRSHVITYNAACALAPVSGQPWLIRHECEATFGDSGSPLLLRQDGRVTLVGIHIGIARGAPALRGIGVLATAFAPALQRATATLGQAP